MFLGEYYHTLDEKNRITIPSKLRDLLHGEFVITRGLEKCLYIYTKEEWEKLVAKLDTLPFTKKDARIVVRSLFSAASKVTLDRAGRIALTKTHLDYAKLEKNCVLIGANNRLEIWSEELWQDFLTTNEDKLEEIAETLFESEY